MPHYTIKEKGRTPVLVHEAPIDEKTKEIRKMFDVDEETGYPRHYNWRPMARLGNEYRPEKVFEVFEPYKPEEMLSTKITIAGSIAFALGAFHVAMQKYRARPIWSKPLQVLGIFGAITGVVLYYYDYRHERQQLKNQIYADYMKKHPERFDTVHRPKFREVLFQYSPIR